MAAQLDYDPTKEGEDNEFFLGSGRTGRSCNIRSDEQQESFVFPREIKGKPVVKLVILSEANPPVISNVLTANEIKVAQGQYKSDGSIDIVCSILYKLMAKAVAEQPSVEWSSYGIVIAEPGKEFTPRNICKFQLTPVPSSDYDAIANGCEIKDGNVKTWQGYLVKLLAAHRVCRIPDANMTYRTNVQKHLQDIFVGDPWLVKNLNQIDAAKSWLDNFRYQALVACYDMFFIHLPSHDLTPLRACSMNTFGQDLAGLDSTIHASKEFGLKGSGIICFSLFESSSSDARKLIEYARGEETGKRDSYFNYCRAFSLILKSPYSSNSLRNLFLFSHYTAALRGNTRSLNSKRLNAYDADSLFINAVLLNVYASKMNIAIPEFGITRAMQQKMHEEYGHLGDANWQTAFEICVKMKNYIDEHGTALTEELRTHFTQHFALFKTSRNDTVGKDISLRFGL